jgi:hypothetical protein
VASAFVTVSEAGVDAGADEDGADAVVLGDVGVELDLPLPLVLLVQPATTTGTATSRASRRRAAVFTD